MKFLFQKNYLLKIVISGIILRLIYLFFKTGDFSKINLGGDPCHHYNIAYNLSNFVGPKTDFIFSFWHRHQDIPAVTDVYLPGFHFFSAIFLFFNDSFVTTRLITLTIFLLNIFLLYLICRELKRKDLAIISIFLVCFNYFHIENSTVFTTVNFVALIIQLYFYVTLLTVKGNNYYYLLGLITGYASLTFGGWQILFVISLINIYINEKKNLFKSFFNFSKIFLIIYSFWAIYTTLYFGSPFYSNLKFYPFVEHWGEMMNSTTKPIISEILINLDIVDYIKKHFLFFIKNLIKISLYNFPTFIFFISFLFFPFLIFWIYEIESHRILYVRIFNFLFDWHNTR